MAYTRLTIKAREVIEGRFDWTGILAAGTVHERVLPAGEYSVLGQLGRGMIYSRPVTVTLLDPWPTILLYNILCRHTRQAARKERLLVCWAVLLVVAGCDQRAALPPGGPETDASIDLVSGWFSELEATVAPVLESVRGAALELRADSGSIAADSVFLGFRRELRDTVRAAVDSSI